jgi:hypothetical protein
MSHNIEVLIDHVMLGGIERNAGDRVTISDDLYADLQHAGKFTDGTLRDLGPTPSGDGVTTQAPSVPAPPETTSAKAAGAAPTKAEFDAVVADVAALRSALNALVSALKGPGKPMAP